MHRLVIITVLSCTWLALSACTGSTTAQEQPEVAPAPNPAKAAAETPAETAPNPLIEAVLAADINQVKELVAAGADVNSSDEHGFRVLVNAMANYNVEIVDYLVNQGAQTGLEKPKSDGNNARLFGEGLGQNELLLAAAESGDIKSVKRLLAAGANINAQDEAGFTVLVTAIAGYHTELVKYLVNQGATIVANSQ
jgi:ankyrin repeat protein